MANIMMTIFVMIGDILIDNIISRIILMMADLNMITERACDGSGNWIVF